MELIAKGQMRVLLKRIIIDRDPTLLNYLTNDNVVRVLDFYEGCRTIFNDMAEKPHQKAEMKKFAEDKIYEFYRNIVS